MKRVLVTGSTRGLGLSLIKEFEKNGYDVIITYNKRKDEAYKLKEKLNCKVDVVKCDITNESDILNLFNNYKIDILINNAALSMDNLIFDKTKDEFMRVLEVNLVGTFLMCKEAIKKGVKEIINISSTDSVNTYNSYNIDYSASKSGVNVITKVIADTYKDVRIIAILPNFINTESTNEMSKEFLNAELKRIGQTKLLDKDIVAKKIYEIYKDANVKSGSLIKIDYKEKLCIEVLE